MCIYTSDGRLLVGLVLILTDLFGKPKDFEESDRHAVLYLRIQALNITLRYVLGHRYVGKLLTPPFLPFR
jgi:hypothetical protein